MTANQRRFAKAVSGLTYCNPFTPERIELERQALGDAFIPVAPTWTPAVGPPVGEESPNLVKLRERSNALLIAIGNKLDRTQSPNPEEMRCYEDVALYALYESCRSELHKIASQVKAGRATTRLDKLWPRFIKAFERYLGRYRDKLTTNHSPAHVFACFFQVRRAFVHIFQHLIGGSAPAWQLRAAVWESIFTHDFRRYYLGLYTRMADFTTLVTGPSGTGKELVARAIGLSRYIPFDPATLRFTEDFALGFFPVNLSAMSPTLIESELFGHKRGAFTGAISDRKGLLESCPPLGTVFLDEVGELDPSIQVKLLRVLQNRSFSRIGETRPRTFTGKIIAATHRNLADLMRRGDFRHDFYYRLCSDMINTPSLQEQFADSTNEIHAMVHHIVCSIGVDRLEADTLSEKVLTWIDSNLGTQYEWPGNFRELEQCVRNVIVHGEYHPIDNNPTSDDIIRSLDALASESTPCETLLSRYVATVYRQTGSYSETARKLGLDRRTVRSRVEAETMKKG